jgi:hypothetical protein
MMAGPKPRHDLAHRILAQVKNPLAETYGRGAVRYPDNEWPPERPDDEDLAHAMFHLDKLTMGKPHVERMVAQLHLLSEERGEDEDDLAHCAARILLPLARRAL